jgi:hypothetical protein
MRIEQPAYRFTLCLTGRKRLQSGVHIRQPDQVVKRDCYSPSRLSAFARPRTYSTGRFPFSSTGVAPRAREVVKRKQKSPDARYGGARKNEYRRIPQLATCASRRMVPAVRRTGHPFAVSGPNGPSQKIECVFAASPETIQGSLGSLISSAQSATCGTWQPARCVIR